MTADQIRGQTFPPGTYFVQSETGQTFTLQQLGATTTTTAVATLPPNSDSNGQSLAPPSALANTLNPPPQLPAMNMSDTTPAICSGTTISHAFGVGIEAARTSADVHQAALALALKIVAAKGGDTSEIAADLITNGLSLVQTWADLKSGDWSKGSLELTNQISFGLVDAILARYHISFPVSDILNLGGSLAGSFIAGFVLDVGNLKCRGA
ncbi:MAG: hypothetical protein JST16_04990 [Bdellovibrionales bacterium]|nr:hypothetical protein [Bdellovibrionales bacterium]